MVKNLKWLCIKTKTRNKMKNQTRTNWGERKMASLKFISEYEGKMPSYVAVKSEKEETPRQEKKFSKVLNLAADMLTTLLVAGCATFGFVVAVFAAFMWVHAI